MIHTHLVSFFIQIFMFLVAFLKVENLKGWPDDHYLKLRIYHLFTSQVQKHQGVINSYEVHSYETLSRLLSQSPLANDEIELRKN